MSEERARRAGRRAELLEQAAKVSRAELRTRRERMIATARPILQSPASPPSAAERCVSSSATRPRRASWGWPSRTCAAWLAE